MSISRNRLYTLLLISCVIGYLWLYYGFHAINTSLEVCLIKHLTGVPCPSCGATRSILTLINGQFLKSLYINPIGFVVAIIMLLAPFWIIYDLITKKSSLYIFYVQIENYFKKPRHLIIFSFLIAINWIWNITKGL